MVYYEVKRWLVVKNATAQLARFDKLCQFKRHMTIDIISLNKAIEIYAALAKKGQLIGDGDTLIAAYCIVNGYTLATNNTEDFQRVDGLQFVNWKA
jgi:predicted nucleic acid-binding protein